MPDITNWQYSAETASGELVSGRLTATGLADAKHALKKRGLTPFKLSEKRGASIGLSPRGRQALLTPTDWVHFSGRMAELLNAGIPVTDALDFIETQSPKSKIGNLAKQLSDQLRSGSSLSDALENSDANAPRLLIALCATGEAVGDLGGQFTRLKADLESRAKLRKEIVANLIYPAALFVLMILTIIFLSFYVLPQFESVFAASSAEPPPETKFVLAAGAFIRDWWIVILGVFGIGIFSVFAFARNNLEKWEAFLLALPIAGHLINVSETARYCRSLGALIVGGVPLARAMPIARTAVSLDTSIRRLTNTEEETKGGGTFSVALKRNAAISPDAIGFVELGENTGMLGDMALRAADFSEQRLSSSLKTFANLSGPVMIAIMGVLTAGVIASVMAGVMSLNDVAY